MVTAIKAAKGVCFRTGLEGNMGKWKGFKTDHPFSPDLSFPDYLSFREEKMNSDTESVKYLQEK